MCKLTLTNVLAAWEPDEICRPSGILPIKLFYFIRDICTTVTYTVVYVNMFTPYYECYLHDFVQGNHFMLFDGRSLPTLPVPRVVMSEKICILLFRG